MTRAVVMDHPGGPGVLTWREHPVPDPGPGEVRVRHRAVGLNFIDVYHRRGLYPLTPLPAVLGSEAAGRIDAVGPGVTGLAIGDRVAYAGGPTGAYSEARVVPADRLVKLPDGIDDQRAAAMMLKGMTAEYLLRRTFRVEPGHTVLIHAAGGGVGTFACQWAKALGATVIGTVGTDEKAKVAAEHGCDHPIVTSREDFVERVRALTRGRGVAVVYDSVGRDTVMRSLDCLAPRGMMVSFGQSSGMVPPLDVMALSAKGSLYLTRPTLSDYTATREELQASAAALFDVVLNGTVRVVVGQTYPLWDAARAHGDLEARRTVGSTVLLP